MTSSFLAPVVDEIHVPLRQWLTLQAELLIAAVARGEPGAADVLRFAGVDGGLQGLGLDLDTARLAVAKDHWFADWPDALAHGDDTVNARFETAADAVHEGDLDALRRLLDEEPSLVRRHSPFPHRQTLLHQVAANGIEAERQRPSPANAVDVLRLLVERGAAPDAICDSYGGGNGATTMCLLVSSVHPFDAGVHAALVRELCRSGARVDGIDDDSAPLWTAISSGYTEAAEALVDHGARVDQLCLAAALGDLDTVRGHFAADGRLRPGTRSERIAPRGPTLPRGQLVEYALIWATAHGRRHVVEYLLTKEPDLRVTEPLFHSTALGMARYHGQSDLIALLDRHAGGA